MKILEKAMSEVGYLEKASSKNLDDKTKNAGSANFTKYARDLVKKIGSPFAQAVAWCQMFVVWCMCQVYGYEKAKELLGGWTAYTPTAVAFYKKMGRYYNTNPQPGDQIFFRNNTRVCHTGFVYKVDANSIYTIEGNTSGASGVIPNGGGVCCKKYAKSNPRIDGFGRPAYGPDVQKSIHEIALEVIAGKWGNGAERKDALVKAGYDYSSVQAEVNKILKGG